MHFNLLIGPDILGGVVGGQGKPVRVRVCFVCSGNICRSPTAEAVLRARVHEAGLDGDIVVDSAGTGSWHVGDDMDRRSRSTLHDAGYRPPRHRARQFTAADFAERDVVLALDGGHLAELRELADESADPSTARASIVLLREFDPELAPDEPAEVGDPYYGGVDGFSEVLAQVERSCAGLVRAITSSLESGAARLAGQQLERPPL